MLTPVLLKNALGYDPLRLPYCGLIWDRLAGGGPSQGQRSPPPAPLDPSDDAGIEEAVLTFFGLPGSDLIQVGVNVPVFLCHSSKKEPSESVRAAGRFSPAAPACPTFVYKIEQRDHFVFR